IQVFDQAVDSFLAAKKVEATGQFDLFGDSDSGGDDVMDAVFAVTVPQGEWDKMGKLAFEREMLGLYVSDHPLLGVEHVLAAHSELTIGALHTDQVGDGQQIILAGILSSVLRRVNKTGSPWASAVLEDLEGSVEVLFFPQTYAQVAVNVAEDAIVVVKGRVDRREDVAKLIASDLSVPDLSEGPRGPVVVSLQAARCTPPVVERLREVLSTHPGTTEVQLQLVNGERRTALRVADGFRVAATPALMGDLKALLGPTCLAG
ncbi:MAG TPA: OB-fold nucleic acid binding domain-containing protein, partial [Mycobacteriales bacterium]|nr:OB-fold nucleic acid binding domain-containing protein [Mycobacteriales bacterium]